MIRHRAYHAENCERAHVHGIGPVIQSSRAKIMWPSFDPPAPTPDVFEVISDGFCCLDPDGRLIYINSAAERMLGRCRSELAGKILWGECPGSATEAPLKGDERMATKNATKDLPAKDSAKIKGGRIRY